MGILPSYDAGSANEFIDVVIPTGLDVGRNQIVVASASVVIVIGGGEEALSEIALASQINIPILLIKNTGGWEDKLSDHYLDNRHNSPIYHMHDIQKLTKVQADIGTNLHSSIGTINSGLNNELNRSR